MFQRTRKGYIEQQIEMLTVALAKILTGKDSGRYEAALTEAADACKQMTGLNLTTLTLLPDETLLNLFRLGGGLDAGRCIITARLLEAQAQVYEAQHRTVAAHVGLHKALVLLLAALSHDETLRTPFHQELIESILPRMTGYVLPSELQTQVAEALRQL